MMTFCLRWGTFNSLKYFVFKLPPGDPLTVVLLGKTGNGKSATGNAIVGTKCFKESGSAVAVTSFCGYGTRYDERIVGVIDTPGIMDTFPVTRMAKVTEKVKDLTGLHNQTQKAILREVARMFLFAPEGFDAVILTVKFGVRLDWHDTEALKILQAFLGEEAKRYMILLFTYGDQAKRNNENLESYMEKFPDYIKEFIEAIGHRTILFNNTLSDPDENKRQLSGLIQVKKVNIHLTNKRIRLCIECFFMIDTFSFIIQQPLF